ncbi:hypothetical protein HY310_00515 [Candidatus Microgenomates bacterium]|nr:hypothetical protein [Candidatus Microgenomates bacterium]
MKDTKPYDLEIIAGPCSLTLENVNEIIDEIAPITTPQGTRAIYGARVVGLKSRTTLPANGKGIGLDYPVINEALGLSEQARKKLRLPSLTLAEKIYKKTGMVIASEIMLPHIQLPFFERAKLNKHVMIWSPAVNQLGWNILEMSNYAHRNNWDLGIKHAKFLGKDPLEVANHPDYKDETSLEKTLLGLTTYAQGGKGDLIIIHRGVDVPGRGDFRNALIHEVMRRVKTHIPHAKLYFDPSHSYGPKLRNKIVEGIIDAMKLTHSNAFLYDGVLIEVGTSPSDTEQHLTTKELQELVNKLSTFRKLRSPK